jgi:hypothetical protein
MKKKIYVCPKCGRGLNFSDNPDYTFQCFECDEDFYTFEAKEMEQPRMEGIVDYTDLAKASMEVKAITDKAIQESQRQIEIKGKDIVEQICEYINETIKPILDTGIYKDATFKDCARIYSNHFQLRFGNYLTDIGECQAQLFGYNGGLRTYFNARHEYYIDNVNSNILRSIVEEWPRLKDTMHRMIKYGIVESNKANQKKLEKQKEIAEVIESFRL